MNYLAGHLDGVKKMIQDGKYCVDIMKQNEAVIAAIRKVNQAILVNHLKTCVAQAIKSRNVKEQRKKIKELLEIFENSKK